MILPDSSAWVEYLRGTGVPVHRELAASLEGGIEVVTTGPVVMELLSGARRVEGVGQLRRLLARFRHLPADDPADYEAAAGVYRSCRRQGRTIRRMADCLIAAVAIRHGAALLHQDSDFDAIAAATSLQVLEPRG